MQCVDPCNIIEAKNPKKFLGCFGNCDKACVDLLAPYSDLFSLVWKTGHTNIRTESLLNQGDKFCFDFNCLNECADAEVEIYDSTGALIQFEDGDCTYSGFSFQIDIKNNK